MKTGFAILTALLGVAVSACSRASEPALVAQIVKATPTKYAVAASTRFLSCKADAPHMMCTACDVTQHDNGADGIMTYATHWHHKLKPSTDKPSGYALSVTGELGQKKFTSSERSLQVAQDLFAQGEKWCAARGKGVYHKLKDEMTSIYGAVPGVNGVVQ